MTEPSTLIEALAEVALTCAGEDCRHLARGEVVEVNAFDVSSAARCQTSAAAPSPPFQADIFNVTKTVALRAVPGLRRLGSALGSVGAVMREAQRLDDGAANDDWVRLFLKDSSIAVRSRVAGRATSWLTQVLNLLAVDDLSETRRWRTKVPLRWEYPGRGLRLRATIDLLVPDPEQPGVLIPVVVGAPGSGPLDAELSYLHVLWKSSQTAVANLPTVDAAGPDGEVAKAQIPASTLRPRTRSSFHLNEVMIVDPREAAVVRRSLIDTWEDGLTAARTAAEAVTERDQISVVNDQAIAAETATRAELVACFPSYLQQQPSRWTCPRCLWMPVCPSHSVASDGRVDGGRFGNAGVEPDLDQGPTGQATAEAPESTNALPTGATTSQPAADGFIVNGGLRLSDRTST